MLEFWYYELKSRHFHCKEILPRRTKFSFPQNKLLDQASKNSFVESATYFKSETCGMVG